MASTSARHGRATRWAILGVAALATALLAFHLLYRQVVFCFEPAVLAHAESSAPRWTIREIRRLPHATDAFTQGLVASGGTLWENTGLYGDSRLRRLDARDGRVLGEVRLEATVFGEGLAKVGNQLFLLTWESGLGFTHAADSLRRAGRYAIPAPAWGLTHDGQRLIMSDGSSTLRFLDPADWKETGRLTVRSGTTPVERLNELEYVGGEIWANVLPTDSIARIRPADGQVVGWIDVTGCALRPWLRHRADILNGIAYDDTAGKLYLTGKRWPFILEAELAETRSP